MWLQEEMDRLLFLKTPPAYDVEEIVEKEFQRVKGQCYLDHAGASLYSERQVQAVFKELTDSLFGNPHSRHTPSDAVTQAVEAVRQRVLEHFNTTAEDYDLVFTSGATDALKLIAENFDWNPKPESPPSNLTATDATTHTNKEEHNNPQCNSIKKSVAGAFVYTQENHTSVVGIRGAAHKANCDIYCPNITEVKDLLEEGSQDFDADSSTGSAPSDFKGRTLNAPQDLTKDSGDVNFPAVENPPVAPRDSQPVRGTTSYTSWQRPQEGTSACNCLFAYSAQCNFSGRKAPLQWIEKVHSGALNSILSTLPKNKRENQSPLTRFEDVSCSPSWYVLLDAACLVATCPLDLARWKPDFVPVSFYKIFGYPTGLGCLLVARRAWGVLQRNYQGGGTVLMVNPRMMVTVPRPILHDRLEDGTLPFLSILAVRHGLDTINRLTGGMQNIEAHVFSLARYTHHCLRSYRHSNGSPVACLYHGGGDHWGSDTHGSIVNFSLLKPDGSFVGYSQVERVASLYNIHLRTGCLCNPGACQTHLDITEEKLLAQFKAGHVCGDAHDLVEGDPTGSVRVSFGYMSTYADADLLLRMIQECFVEAPLIIDLTWMEGGVLPISGWETETERQERGGESRKAVEIHHGRDMKEDHAQNKENGRNSADPQKLGADRVATKRIPEANALDHDKFSPTLDKNLVNNGCTTGQSSSPPLNTVKAVQTNTTGQCPFPPAHDVTATEIIDSAEQEFPSHLTSGDTPTKLSLTDIIVYPVKSCGGVRVREWEVGQGGLWLDRQWMIVTGAGVTLTMKRLPRMALVRPRFDIKAQLLILSCEGEEEEVAVPFEPPPSHTSEVALCGGRVCGDRVQGRDCGPEVGKWLSLVLGKPDLRLVQQTNHRSSRWDSGANGSPGESLSLANESQYLVIHRTSVRSLLEEIHSRGLEELTEEELVHRFRGNLVLDGGVAYEEDSWTSFTINGNSFQVRGRCRRCQMVCVVPTSGERTREPMLTLAASRGSSMLFGVHASAARLGPEGGRLCIGAPVVLT